MIQNHYLSRNVADPDIFETVYHARLRAKKEGDKKTDIAMKLVLNTTYGASNNKYNDLFDPLMAHSVCISGQLYLLELTMSLGNNLSRFVLCQLNTDGVMIYIPRTEVPKAREIVDEWSKRTGFGMEEDVISLLRQRDVNNYCIRKSNGKVKAKGATLSDWEGGSFKHNSLSIVCKAMVSNLLDDVPVEDTINNCTDIFKFQMIAKAGGSYDKVIHQFDGGERDIQRVNRIYASENHALGTVFKVKSNGRRDKLASAPEHSIIDNEGTLSIDKIDKGWYIDLCNERLMKFRGIKPTKSKKTRSKKMIVNDEEEVIDLTDEDDAQNTPSVVKQTEDKPKKKRTRSPKMPRVTVVEETQETAVEQSPEVNSPKALTFKQKLFNLQEDMTEYSKGFVKDGYNSGQSYEYVKAQQYKTLLRKCLSKNRLIGKLDDMMCNMSDILKGDKMVLTLYHGVYTISDADSENDKDCERYMIWSQGSDPLDKGLSKAKTLAIKDFVKSNFLLSDGEDDVEADQTTNTVTVAPKKQKFVTPAESATMVKTVVSQVSPASESDIAEIRRRIAMIREAKKDPNYGEMTLVKSASMSSTDALVALTNLETRGNDYNLVFTEGAK